MFSLFSFFKEKKILKKILKLYSSRKSILIILPNIEIEVYKLKKITGPDKLTMIMLTFMSNINE